MLTLPAGLPARPGVRLSLQVGEPPDKSLLQGPKLTLCMPPLMRRPLIMAASTQCAADSQHECAVPAGGIIAWLALGPKLGFGNDWQLCKPRSA